MTAIRNTLAALLHRLPAGVAAGGGDRVRGRVVRETEEVMTGSDLSGAMRWWHLADHLLVIVVPWIVGMVWLSAYAVRFAFRVWEWVT